MLSASDLPTVNALLNSTSVIFLLAGYRYIRSKQVERHRLCMIIAFCCSILFLISYLTYHSLAGSRPFPGTGVARSVYLTILLTHTLLAAIGRSRAAIRAALFHLGFSVISSTLGLLFVHQITNLASASAERVAQQIANAHVGFNIAGALLFLPFLPAIGRSLERIIPDREKRG